MIIQKHYRGYQVRKTNRVHLYVSPRFVSSPSCTHTPGSVNSPCADRGRDQDGRWAELMKSSEEHAYAQEQLENRNDVKSRSVHPYTLQ